MTIMQKRIGKILLIIHISLLLFSIFFVLFRLILSSWIEIPPCYIRTHLGIYCPGCGGTTSFFLLLKGNIWQSFLSYPAILITILLIGIWDCIYFSSLVFKKDFILKAIWFRSSWIILISVVVNTILKNIL